MTPLTKEELVEVDCLFYKFYITRNVAKMYQFDATSSTPNIDKEEHSMKRSRSNDCLVTSNPKRRYCTTLEGMEIGLSNSKFKRSFRHHCLSHQDLLETKSLPDLSNMKAVLSIQYYPTFESFFSYVCEVKQAVCQFFREATLHMITPSLQQQQVS